MRRLAAGLALLLAASAAADPRVERVDPRLDALIPPGAAIETLAAGFTWVEGPLWDARTHSLLFSDVVRNVVYRWTPAVGARPFLSASGYSGDAPFAGREPGANGLGFDREGRLLLCEHGDRRVTRLERDGRRSVLADRFRGKRLNSPNDLFVAPNGDVYITDPPFGLPLGFDDPARELSFQGVFRLRAGALELLTDEVRAPNGIALSPSGDTLYVSNADRSKPVWLAFALRADGSLAPGRILFDASPWVEQGLPGAPDGLEVDAHGHLFAAGPGGVHILAPDGTRLGMVWIGTATSNVHLADGALFVTAGDTVYRVSLAR